MIRMYTDTGKGKSKWTVKVKLKAGQLVVTSRSSSCHGIVSPGVHKLLRFL